jgi:hypothetical protein
VRFLGDTEVFAAFLPRVDSERSSLAFLCASGRGRRLSMPWVWRRRDQSSEFHPLSALLRMLSLAFRGARTGIRQAASRSTLCSSREQTLPWRSSRCWKRSLSGPTALRRHIAPGRRRQSAPISAIPSRNIRSVDGPPLQRTHTGSN